MSNPQGENPQSQSPTVSEEEDVTFIVSDSPPPTGPNLAKALVECAELGHDWIDPQERNYCRRCGAEYSV